MVSTLPNPYPYGYARFVARTVEPGENFVTYLLR